MGFKDTDVPPNAFDPTRQGGTGVIRCVILVPPSIAAVSPLLARK